MIKYFRQVTSENQDIDRLSRNVLEFTLPLVQNPLIDGVWMKGVTVSATSKQVPHTLGRDWQGFIVTNKNVLGVDVIATHDVLDSKFIKLTADGSATIDIWLF